MNCLNNANIKLLGELCTKTESRMLKYRNFGKKSLTKSRRAFRSRLALGMNFSDELNNAINAEAERVKAAKKEEA
jgi:DNA-directed RNA polymerase subunit alpha